MSIEVNFSIGEIVTLKSHPLFKEYKAISEFPSLVPPLMIVKDIFIEDNKKKKLYNDELGKEFQVSDLVKYTCVYFNSNKSEFVEAIIYQSILESYTKLKYIRKSKDEKFEADVTLVNEVANEKIYKPINKYEYGKKVQFKSKKLEQRKTFVPYNDSIRTSYQTPDFILSGVKNEPQTDLFYPNGEMKRKIANQSYKVIWYNHFQQKFSEQYLPKEFFVEGVEI
jgi:hypothetical protein